MEDWKIGVVTLPKAALAVEMLKVSALRVLVSMQA